MYVVSEWDLEEKVRKANDMYWRNVALKWVKFRVLVLYHPNPYPVT